MATNKASSTATECWEQTSIYMQQLWSVVKKHPYICNSCRVLGANLHIYTKLRSVVSQHLYILNGQLGLFQYLCVNLLNPKHRLTHSLTLNIWPGHIKEICHHLILFLSSASLFKILNVCLSSFCIRLCSLYLGFAFPSLSPQYYMEGKGKPPHHVPRKG